MGDAEITASSWKLVEVGRVALFSAGPYAGKLAAIVQIIDHKRVRPQLSQVSKEWPKKQARNGQENGTSNSHNPSHRSSSMAPPISPKPPSPVTLRICRTCLSPAL